MAKSDLRIDILGTSITISADEEAAYLNTLLSKYRAAVENVQRASALNDPLKIAVLTGFLLCDDLYKAGTPPSGDRESGELEQITLGMISRLEEVLQVSGTVDPPYRPDSASPHTETELTVIDTFFKLQNTVKNFEWGSPKWLPELMGQKNLSRIPWAELWMGVHPAGPSRVIMPDGQGPLLSELIGGDPETFLGKETAETFGKLPFLFKVVAAAKPLSIQAHPNKKQAQEGFDRENRAGIPLDAPTRNYRDSNHKPEILCALSPFAALCGFREAKEISAFITILHAKSDGPLKSDLERLLSALEQTGRDAHAAGENPLKAFLGVLFSLSAETFRALGLLLKNRQPLLEKDFPQYKDEWDLCSYFFSLYPGDSGVLAPLYLNIIELAPGEAIYLPAGVLHAYLHGMGIELMADSDNVLRGGLTPKHVDVDELLRILDFSAYKPDVLTLPDPVPALFTYPAPAGDFALSLMHGSDAAPCQGKEASILKEAPILKEASIVMVSKGSATLTGKNGARMTLNAGESVFIPAGEKAGVVFSGTFTAYAATAAPGR